MKKYIISLIMALVLLLSIGSMTLASTAKYFTNLDEAIASTPDSRPILIDFYTDW